MNWLLLCLLYWHACVFVAPSCVVAHLGCHILVLRVNLPGFTRKSTWWFLFSLSCATSRRNGCLWAMCRYSLRSVAWWPSQTPLRSTRICSPGTSRTRTTPRYVADINSSTRYWAFLPFFNSNKTISVCIDKECFLIIRTLVFPHSKLIVST